MAPVTMAKVLAEATDAAEKLYGAMRVIADCAEDGTLDVSSVAAQWIYKAAGAAHSAAVNLEELRQDEVARHPAF